MDSDRTTHLASHMKEVIENGGGALIVDAKGDRDNLSKEIDENDIYFLDFKNKGFVKKSKRFKSNNKNIIRRIYVSKSFNPLGIPSDEDVQDIRNIMSSM